MMSGGGGGGGGDAASATRTRRAKKRRVDGSLIEPVDNPSRTATVAPSRESTLHDWDVEFGRHASAARATDNSLARGFANARVSLLDLAATTQAIMSATGMGLTTPVAAGMCTSDASSSIEQLIGASVEIHEAMKLHTAEVLAGMAVPVVNASHRGYVEHRDVPTVWPEHHATFLRPVNDAAPAGYVERVCSRAQANMCEAVHYYHVAYGGLREYLTPPEEQLLVESSGATYPARPPVCLLCWRLGESMIYCSRRATDTQAYQLTASRRWVDSTGTRITTSESSNDIVPINSEQVAVGLPGAYRKDAIISSRDGGDSEIGFLAGGVLRYERSDYMLRPDGTLSQDTLLF